MTRDELLFLQQHLEQHGLPARAIVALAEGERHWRIRKAGERAVKRALFPPHNHSADPGKMVPPGAIAQPESGLATKMNNPDSAAHATPAGDRASGTEAMAVPAETTGAGSASRGSTKAAARAALLMMPGLSPAARKVGGHLVECFNLGTGRCFPPIRDLRDAAGLSTDRSARRALRELEGRQLIVRRLHGAGRTNSYGVNWERLRAAALATENTPKMNNPDSAAQARTLSSANPDSVVRHNLGIKPIDSSVRQQRARKAPRPDPRQPQFKLPIPGGRHGQQREQADSAGQRRWWAAVGGKYRDKPDILAAVISLPEAAIARIDAAERERRDGLGQAETELRQAMGTGPPARGTG